jgi:amino-acid N-acetyltransferase
MLIRSARTQDVRVIRELIDQYAPDRRLLSKATVTLYEDITDFMVADDGGLST